MTDIRILLPTDVVQALLNSPGANAGNPFATISDVQNNLLTVETATMGVIEGGELSDGGGLVLNVDAGYGYYEQFPDNDVIIKHIWTATTLTLPANSDLYIYFDNTGTLTSSPTRPDTFFNILLGRVVTKATSFELIDASPLEAEHTSNRYFNLLAEAMGPIYAFGSIVTENATPFHLNNTAGEYYYGTNEFVPVGGTDLTFEPIYGGITHGTSQVVAQSYDNAGVLTALGAGTYAKHCLYLVGGRNLPGPVYVPEEYHLVYGTTTYPSLLAAQQGNLPTPPSWVKDGVVLVACIIVQGGAVNINQIIDSRPRLGFVATGVNASADHQSLLNLTTGNAGHSQFMMLNGSTPMAGNLSLGGFAITNSLSYDGLVVAAAVVTTGTWNATPLDLAYGGTGQVTANAAFNALVPSQGGNTGKFLTTDGVNTSWAANPLGTVTSVSGGTTGLTFSTPTTTPTMAGILIPTNGGTGVNGSAYVNNGLFYWDSGSTTFKTSTTVTYDNTLAVFTFDPSAIAPGLVQVIQPAGTTMTVGLIDDGSGSYSNLAFTGDTSAPNINVVLQTLYSGGGNSSLFLNADPSNAQFTLITAPGANDYVNITANGIPGGLSNLDLNVTAFGAYFDMVLTSTGVQLTNSTSPFPASTKAILNIASSSSSISAMNIASGVTPAGAAMVDGNLWYDSSLKFRKASTTYDLLSGVPPIADNIALIKNSVTPTKQAILSAVNITAATTRTYTLPNLNTKLLGYTNSSPNAASGNVFYMSAGGATDNTAEATSAPYLNWNGSNLVIETQATSGLSGFRGHNNLNANRGTFGAYGATGANFTGTTISNASFLGIDAVGSFAFTIATNLYSLIGSTGTNYGTKLDATGFRIDTINALQTANTVPFAVGSNYTYSGDLVFTMTSATNGVLNHILNNTSAGNAAYAQLIMKNNLAHNLVFGMVGGSTTTAVRYPQDGAFIENTGAGNLVIISSNAASGIQFMSGSTTTISANINTAGNFFFGGSTSATSVVHIGAGTAAVPNMTLNAQTSYTGTTNGSLWHDTTQKSFMAYIDGVKQDISTCLFTQTADKTVSNTTTETSIIGTGTGTVTLPTNFFVVGKTVRVKVYGDMGAIAAATSTLKMKYGATTIGTSAALIALPTLTSPEMFEIEFIITCRTTGATGTVSVVGRMIFHDSTTTSDFIEITRTTTTVDTTTSNALDVTWTWGGLSVTNTITSSNSTFEILN